MTTIMISQFLISPSTLSCCEPQDKDGIGKESSCRAHNLLAP